MFRCEMEGSIDCRAHWKLKHTSQGTCITLNTNQAYMSKLLKTTREKQKRSSNPKIRRNRSISTKTLSWEALTLKSLKERVQARGRQTIERPFKCCQEVRPV